MARILVVDDDPSIREVVAVALDGHHVTPAADGDEALALLAEHRFDLILLDVMMPKLDGFALLRRIRVDPKLADIAVVLLTAKVGEDDHLRGYQYGADGYVTKPFDPADLEATVRTVAARSPEARARVREEEKSKASLLRQLERRFD